MNSANSAGMTSMISKIAIGIGGKIARSDGRMPFLGIGRSEPAMTSDGWTEFWAVPSPSADRGASRFFRKNGLIYLPPLLCTRGSSTPYMTSTMRLTDR